MSDADAATTEVAPTPEPSLDEVVAKVFGAPEATAAEPDKPAAPVVAAPKDPATERVAARIAVAQRAELRAAKARQEHASAQAEIAAQRAEIAEQLKIVEALKGAKASPSKALELLGLSPKEFLESLATEHEPAAVAARAVQGTQGEVEQLKARLEAFEKAEKDRVEQVRAQRLDADYNDATKAFLAHVDAGADKYPHLHAEHTPQELASMARHTAEQHGRAFYEKYGEYPSDDILAEYLEEQAKARAEVLAERRARIGKSAPVPSQGKLSGVQQVAQPDPGPSPRTLTSRAASEKASSPSVWSQEWADQESLRILSASLKAG